MHVSSSKTPVSGLPNTKLSVRDVFGIDSDMQVPAFSETDEHVPDLDADYLFDRTTTLAILAGLVTPVAVPASARPAHSAIIAPSRG